MIDPSLAAVLQAVLIGAALVLALFPSTTTCERSDAATAHPPPPPTLPGLPFLGNAVALARGGAAVLLAARRAGDGNNRRRYGDCFAVRAFPFAPPLVFCFHPSAVARFFAAPEDVLSFKPAVRQFTERVFGLPADEFSASHEPLLDALRALLSPPATLRAHAARIAARAAPMLDGWAAAEAAEAVEDKAGELSGGGGQPFDLWPRARTLVFRAAGGALFGDRFFERHGAERLERLFLDFEGGFERAASPVPHALLPRFVRGKRGLLQALSESLDKGDFEGTCAGELAARSGVRKGLQPNLLLSVMWASQANSMPAFFWALAFLLVPENSAWLARVRERAGEGAAKGQDDESDRASAAVVDAALDPSGPAQRVANESIRVRAHSIAIRLVPPRRAGGGGGFDVPVEDGGSGGDADADRVDGGGKQRRAEPPPPPTPPASLRRAPPGCVLAVCPFETHSDPRFFSPHPEAFDPGRPPTEALPGGAGVGMGFGGGFWRCPGRLFAGMELGLLLTMAVTRLDFKVVVADSTAESSAAAAAAASASAAEAEAPTSTPAAAGLLWWERAAVALLGPQRAMFGLGIGLERWKSEPAAAAPAAPFSPPLPPPDLSRLVGFKVPAAPLLVAASSSRPQQPRQGRRR
jgi:cytochrome P450